MTNNETSFAELLWGHKPKERYVEIFKKGKKATSKEAKDVLEAMVCPEARKVLSCLDAQMKEKSVKASYEGDLIDAICDGTVLFCDESYAYGIYAGFTQLIESAYPDYKWVESPIGAMCFKRK